MPQIYKVTRNIIYNFLAQAFVLSLSVFTTPYIIHKLGNDAYGVLAIVNVFIGYLSLLDLGFGVSIVKYISESVAKQDKGYLEKLIRTSVSIYMLIGMVGAILIFVFAKHFVIDWIRVPVHLAPTALSIFYVSGLGFLVNMGLSVFSSIPNALQRMDLTSQRTIIFSLLNTLGVISLLFFGQGLRAVVFWNVLTSITATITFVIITRKLLPGVSLRPGFDKKVFIKLFRFSTFKLLGNISGQVVFHLDRVLIGVFRPVAEVTFYTAPLMLVQKGTSVLANITQAVFPAISESFGLKDKARIKDLYFRMNKFVIFVIFPVSILLFIFSRSIMSIWLGEEFAQKSTLTLQILSIAYFVGSLSAPPVTTAEALGRPGIPAFFAVVSGVINLTAALVLIPRYGIEGAAWALLINFLAQVPIFIIVVNERIIKVSSIKLFSDSYLRPLFSGGLAALVAYKLLARMFVGDNFVNLAFGIIVFSLLYLLFNLFIGTFDEKDKLMLYHFINKFKFIRVKDKSI